MLNRVQGQIRNPRTEIFQFSLLSVMYKRARFSDDEFVRKLKYVDYVVSSYNDFTVTIYGYEIC